MDILQDIKEARQCHNTAVSSSNKDRINKTGNVRHDVTLRRVRAAIFAAEKQLTLYLLTWRILRVPNNASKGQMGFNLAFKGLILYIPSICL